MRTALTSDFPLIHRRYSSIAREDRTVDAGADARSGAGAGAAEDVGSLLSERLGMSRSEAQASGR